MSTPTAAPEMNNPATGIASLAALPSGTFSASRMAKTNPVADSPVPVISALEAAMPPEIIVATI